MCRRCVMDTTDPNITFDAEGVCNHCRAYKQVATRHQKTREDLDMVVGKLQDEARGASYDCILGISGGTDSSFVAWLAHHYNLRVLLTHFDNGYDDPRATRNIECIVEQTGYDLEPFTMDLDEFHDLQIAFLKASVIDVEMVTDHAITASIYQLALKHNIKSILSGSNITTETIMPRAWGHTKGDLTNIKDIHHRYGTKTLKTFPHASVFKQAWYEYINKIQTLKPLNYIDYNRKQAKTFLAQTIGWEDYGHKHYESIFTRFYQAYILPVKFGVDKRKAHFSNLICSGQMTREQALKELEAPPYSPQQLRYDRVFVLDQLGLSPDEFERLMQLPPKPHSAYASAEWLYKLLRTARRIFT
jgi:N-acetyl sugar amidotransferase